MRKEKIVIKVDQTQLPNPLHLNIQQTYRGDIYKPKKGKGSFSRKCKHKQKGEQD